MNDANVSPVIALAQALIQRQSVTPEDANCQSLMNQRLQKLGFNIEEHFFVDTLNTWARKGHSQPHFCFAGHTDVVPVGDEAAWQYPPFSGTIENGMLHGRGAADMKGSLAAMVIAKEPIALQLRYLQTLTEVAAEKNSTTIFPVPIDLLEPFMNKIFDHHPP